MYSNKYGEKTIFLLRKPNHKYEIKIQFEEWQKMKKRALHLQAYIKKKYRY